jgi:hypothetical protein
MKNKLFNLSAICIACFVLLFNINITLDSQHKPDYWLRPIGHIMAQSLQEGSGDLKSKEVRGWTPVNVECAPAITAVTTVDPIPAFDPVLQEVDSVKWKISGQVINRVKNGNEKKITVLRPAVARTEVVIKSRFKTNCNPNGKTSCEEMDCDRYLLAKYF